MYQPADLKNLLHTHQLAALRDTAEELRGLPPSFERIDAAQRLVRHVMYEHAIGRITRRERGEMLDLLGFALPLPEQTADRGIPQDRLTINDIGDTLRADARRAAPNATDPLDTGC